LHGVVGDQDVDAAVGIDVGENGAQRLRQRHASVGIANVEARGLADLLKPSAAVVAIEIGKRSLEVLRPAVCPAPTGQLKILAFVVLARPLDVVADKEVEITVVVVVEPAAAGAPRVVGSGYAGLARNVTKLPIAFVVEQSILADGGKKNVGRPSLS
jgi:hypothetical protein